jgi:hypothetical protein
MANTDRIERLEALEQQGASIDRQTHRITQILEILEGNGQPGVAKRLVYLEATALAGGERQMTLDRLTALETVRDATARSDARWGKFLWALLGAGIAGGGLLLAVYLLILGTLPVPR